MKKAIILLLVSLVCLLAGCIGVPHNKTIPDSGDSSGLNSPQAKFGSPPAIPFEAEESLIGDPPEGALSVFEAQKQLAAMVADMEDQTLWETQGLFYMYRGIETGQDGTECYRIDLCARDKSGSKPVTLRSYLAGIERTFYCQLNGGAWQLIGSN